MDTQQTSQDMSPKEILFPNGHRAQLVIPPAGAKAADTLKALGMEQPEALILVVGSAAGLDADMKSNEELRSRLVQLFSRGIACAAVEVGALILDGGTQSGVMALMGQGVADRGRQSILLGVAPAGKVTYPGGPAEEGSLEDGAPLDSNHSRFVLVEGDQWGDETHTMFELAAALGAGIPVVTVLVHGRTDSVAKKEVLCSVRQRWPVVVVQGSGPLADEIAAWWQKKQTETTPPFIPDPVIAEIVADGDIHLFPLECPVAGLKRGIIRQLGVDATLKMAWERFALHDDNAVHQRKKFERAQRWILFLGVTGTLLALAQTQLRMLGLLDDLERLDQGLHYAIVAIPITTSALLAAVHRFKAGNKWVLLRGSAEAIKREVFRYRTRAGIYSYQQTTNTSREVKLARKVKSISRQLMETEVNVSALRPYEGPIPPEMYGAAADDDGFNFLAPDRYITIRISDQLNYYEKRTNQLEKKLKWCQWAILIFGGVGTLLAAIGLELWIALTTALAVAFTTFLEYQQVENTLVKYNQAATGLANVQGWWMALSAEEQADQRNVDKLVEYTEKTIEGELTGWVQQMQDVLVPLHAEQTGEEGGPASICEV